VPPSAEAGDDLGRLIASGGGDCRRQSRAGEVVVPVIAADPATCRRATDREVHIHQGRDG